MWRLWKALTAEPCAGECVRNDPGEKQMQGESIWKPFPFVQQSKRTDGRMKSTNINTG